MTIIMMIVTMIINLGQGYGNNWTLTICKKLIFERVLIGMVVMMMINIEYGDGNIDLEWPLRYLKKISGESVR